MTKTMVNEVQPACNADWDLPFLPDTASLTPTSAGWLYSDSGRVYRLERPEIRGGSVRGLLEAWTPAAYACRWSDWSVADERIDMAKLLSKGDAELEESVRQDIFRLRLAVIMLKIRVELDALIDVDPDWPEPWGRGVQDEAEIIIRGLDARGRRIIRRNAERLGGACTERRIA